MIIKEYCYCRTKLVEKLKKKGGFLIANDIFKGKPDNISKFIYLMWTMDENVMQIIDSNH